MDLSVTEQAVMERFALKTQTAGGAKAGYVLRRQALAEGVAGGVDGGIEALVERGLLVVGDSGDFVYLTSAGAEALGAAPA